MTLTVNNKALATLSSPTVTIPAGQAQTPIFFVKTPVTSVPETVSLTASFGSLAVSEFAFDLAGNANPHGNAIGGRRRNWKLCVQSRD